MFIREDTYLSRIYITGHRNPDLDAVLSAMAYAELKNRIDPDNEYVAVRCGHLSDSIRELLGKLGITPPPYMHDVSPKMRDVMLTDSRRIDCMEPISNLSFSFSVDNPSATPIYKNGEFYGLLTNDDIAQWFMDAMQIGEVKSAPLIQDIMRHEAPSIQADEHFDEGRALLLNSGSRSLAVMDGDRFAGFATRRCFLKKPSYKIILVDHNEAEQSIRGVDEATVLEIIDHHKLNPVRTDLPIFIDSEPIGSTCTIIYQLYMKNRIQPDEKVAKYLLAGLISDTLILKSPTTTGIDRAAASALAAILKTSASAFGTEMFSDIESLASRDPEKTVQADFKSYKEHGVSFGIGQCEVSNLHEVREVEARYLEALGAVKMQKALDWVMVMVTDVVYGDSVLLSTDHSALRHLPYSRLRQGVYDMPGVMSRKKQLLPEVLHALSTDF